jgi:FixJ family two-component response regulator
MTGETEVVFLVDDDPAILRAVGRVLHSAGLKTIVFDSPRQFLSAHDPGVPGCVVLDLSMPGIDGLEVQERLATANGGRPIIFLTGRADVPTSVRAMKKGAVDFLTKPVDADALIQAVSRALEKDRREREARREADSVRVLLRELTPREHEVFVHVVAGKLNKQVAAELGASEKTIKVHRGRVMEKLRAASLADLVRLAQRAGIREPD